MNPTYQTDEALAREAAAFELVGVVSTLLRTAERNGEDEVVIRLGPRGLALIVATFNRATAKGPLSADDVGR